MVGQKVIWEALAVRGLRHLCTDGGVLLRVGQEVLETRRFV